jgi:glycine cleavage system regulatory protein
VQYVSVDVSVSVNDHNGTTMDVLAVFTHSHILTHLAAHFAAHMRVACPVTAEIEEIADRLGGNSMMITIHSLCAPAKHPNI